MIHLVKTKIDIGICVGKPFEIIWKGNAILRNLSLEVEAQNNLLRYLMFSLNFPTKKQSEMGKLKEKIVIGQVGSSTSRKQVSKLDRK